MLIHFEELENVKKSGLFEFIRSHDKKLYEKLDLFYSQIYPKLAELIELHGKTRKETLLEWIDYIANVISDEKTKNQSRNFVNKLFQRGMYGLLLNSRTEEISKIWNETLSSITPSLSVSQDNMKELIELSHAKIQKLLDLYNQIKASLEHEVVKGLIPMMQKYIRNPLSRP